MLILSKHGGQMPQTFARKDLCETAFHWGSSTQVSHFCRHSKSMAPAKSVASPSEWIVKGYIISYATQITQKNTLSMYQICSGECIKVWINRCLWKGKIFHQRTHGVVAFRQHFQGTPWHQKILARSSVAMLRSSHVMWDVLKSWTVKRVSKTDFDLVWFALFRLRGRYTYQDIWWSLACQVYCIWSSKGNACCSYCQYLPYCTVAFPQAESQALAIISHIAVHAFLYMRTFDSSVLIDTTTILTKERKRRETADGHSHGFLQSASFWPSTRGARELCFFVSLSQGPSKMVILNTGSVQSRSALGSTTGILSHPVCKTW